MAAGCHGTSSAIRFASTPASARRSIGAQRANYDVSIRMLALDGDPAQSRLLRKMLPLHDNGIVHKGNNTGFLRDATTRARQSSVGVRRREPAPARRARAKRAALARPRLRARADHGGGTR
jgi:hypothetical protein